MAIGSEVEVEVAVVVVVGADAEVGDRRSHIFPIAVTPARDT